MHRVHVVWAVSAQMRPHTPRRSFPAGQAKTTHFGRLNAARIPHGGLHAQHRSVRTDSRMATPAELSSTDLDSTPVRVNRPVVTKKVLVVDDEADAAETMA